MNRRVKIFLALGEELKDESLELSDLVAHLNLILEPQDIHIYLTKWDYLAASALPSTTENIDSALEDCEICMVVFGKDFGSFTEQKLKNAYKRVCQEGVNPSKLYVYFKSVESISEDLRRLRDSFPEKYGHFTGKFSDVNALKNDFLLQFQLFQNKHLQNACPVEISDSKVTVFGKDLFIDLMKIPFLGNNDTYKNLLKSIRTTKKILAITTPEDDDYGEYAAQLRELTEKRDNLEKSLWTTAVEIARLSNQKCSKRLQKAIKLFNSGDNRGAAAILDTDDILRDAEHNLLMGNIHGEGLKTNIEELKLKIKTLKIQMAEGWRDTVARLQENVIKYVREAYGEGSEEYIETLDEGASLYSLLGQFDKALELEEEALDLSIQFFGEENQVTATALKNCSIAYGNLGDLNQEIEYGLKALDMHIKTFGATHRATATSFDNLGLTFSDLGEYQKALEYCSRALDIRIKVLGEEHTETVDSLINIGSIYLDLGDCRKALDYLQKSLDINMTKHGAEHPETAISFNLIGDAYRELGDYQRTLDYYQRALDIVINTYGVDHPRTAASLDRIGNVFREIGDYQKDLDYKLKVAAIRMKVLGTEHPDTATALNNLGLAYESIGEHEKALDYLLEALDILLKTMGAENPNAARSFDNIGTVYGELGDHRTALEYKLRALECFIYIYGEEHPDTVLMLESVASTYEDLGEHQMALKYVERANEISKTASTYDI